MRKAECPLGGRCNVTDVAYLGEVHAKDINGNALPGEPKKYWGQTVLFKQRFYGHNTTFNTPKKVLTRKDKTTGEEKQVSLEEQIEEKKQKSELANHIWRLKEKGKKYEIKWSIARKAHNYKNGDRNCDLCVTEKTLIALGDPETMLNKRTEIFRKCTEMNKFKFSHFVGKKPP